MEVKSSANPENTTRPMRMPSGCFWTNVRAASWATEKRLGLTSVEHIERESYGVAIREGLEGIHDPVFTLHNSIRHQAEFFGRNADLLRTFYAQAVSDPDFRAVWDDRLQERWDALNWLVEWIARDGRLAEGWDAKEATDWLWSLTGFRLYEELVIERGWSAEQLTRHGVQAISMVLADRDLPGDG